MKFRIYTILSCCLFLRIFSAETFLKENNNIGHGEYNNYSHKHSSKSMIYHHIKNEGNNRNIRSLNFNENHNKKFTPVRTSSQKDYANNPFLNRIKPNSIPTNSFYTTERNVRVSSSNKVYANNPFLNPTISDLAKINEINNNIRESNKKPFANNPFLNPTKSDLANIIKSNISQNNGNIDKISKPLSIDIRSNTQFITVRESSSKMDLANNQFLNTSASDSSKIKVVPELINANMRKTPSRDDI